MVCEQIKKPLGCVTYKIAQGNIASVLNATQAHLNGR